MKFKSLIFCLSLVLISCSSEDDSFNSMLEGRSYMMTAFTIETPVDVNNDGIYSFNLIEEDTFGCQNMNRLSFMNGTSSAPIEYGPILRITENNTQDMGCYVIDYFAALEYTVDVDMMTVNVAGFIGEISGNMIIFRPNNSQLDSLGEILLQDGSVETYDGNYVLEFTLIQ
ncbi:hypothetical protein Q2T40_12795 [Winogradskyella maritima]|uniref:Lipocalin-like protein n=1 Tax=Winogradskyella maritima TaxID=1517766 RepID=A0ABV8AKF2_9FLAO|nr:hypothetical protein [Winogradskyella maritima]